MTKLFSRLRIGNVELANRITVSPMCQYTATDGIANDWHLSHYGAFANSGAALVVVEATAVELAGRITHGDLGLFDDATEASLCRLVQFYKEHGNAKLGIQLAHAGRKGSAKKPWEGGSALSEEEQPWQTFAPSAIALAQNWHVPAEMHEGDLERIRDAHVAAARRAVNAGFDMIEVHAAHGYLLHQFLSPLSNHRTDGYGGTFEERMRFPLAVISAVRQALPDDFPLGIRITGTDWIDHGLEVGDAVQFASQLRDIGVNFVCVTGGGIVPNVSPKIGPAYQTGFAETVRRETGILTRAVGLIATPALAESVISSGQADFVALGRPFLVNPHWGWYAAQELGSEIVRPRQYLRAARL